MNVIVKKARPTQAQTIKALRAKVKVLDFLEKAVEADRKRRP